MADQETNVANFFSTTLTSSITDTDTTIPVDSIGTLTSPCFIIIDPTNVTSREIVLADGTFGASSFVCSDSSKRGQSGSAGSTAHAHASGTEVTVAPLSQHLVDLHDRLDAHDHTGSSAGTQLAHSDLSGLGAGGTDHTDVPLLDGSRPFTGKQAGVATAAADPATTLATKGYVDGRIATGTITMFGAAAAPSGWLLCNGQAVSRTTYADLFALIGTTWGAGDGSTTFNVPDLRGRFPVGSGGSYSPNDKGGADSVTLATSQIPGHTHTGPSHQHSVNPPATNTSDDTHKHGRGSLMVYNVHKALADTVVGTGSGERLRTTGANVDFAVSGETANDTHDHSVNIGSFNSGAAGTGSTGSAGGGGSHENRPPYIGVPFIIKT